MKVHNFETVTDGIASRVLHAIDVISLDWQANGTNHIVVIRGSSADREVRVRFEFKLAGPGVVELSTYALGSTPDTMSWSIDFSTRAMVRDLFAQLTSTI